MTEIKLLLSPTFDIPEGSNLIGFIDGTFIVSPEMDMAAAMSWGKRLVGQAVVISWHNGGRTPLPSASTPDK